MIGADGSLQSSDIPKADEFIGLLQQNYGYTREEAEKEFDRRLKEAK